MFAQAPLLVCGQIAWPPTNLVGGLSCTCGACADGLVCVGVGVYIGCRLPHCPVRLRPPEGRCNQHVKESPGRRPVAVFLLLRPDLFDGAGAHLPALCWRQLGRRDCQ